MRSRLAAVCILLVWVLSVAQSQVRPVRVRVSEGVMQSFVSKKVSPDYPPLARQARIQGTVILQVEINKSGHVESVQLFSGHPMLAQAAIDAVKQWEYKPYLLNGEPVGVETHVKINFTLPEKLPSEGIVGDRPGGIPEGVQGDIVSNIPADPVHPAVPGRVRVSRDVMAGLLVAKVSPEYPPDAKNARIQGTVAMRVVIDKEGNVLKAQLISGHPLLAPAALDAVKQWTYKPYLLNGEPVEIETQVIVNFTLAN